MSEYVQNKNTWANGFDSDACKICGLSYVRESPEDQRNHRSYHRRFTLRWTRAKKEPIAGIDGELRVIVVAPGAPLWLSKRAENTAFTAHADTNFDSAAYHATDPHWELGTHAFIGVIDQDVVAFLVLERRSHVVRVTWVEWDSKTPEGWDTEDAAQWTICFAWTAKTFRARGIARRTIQIVASWASCQVQELAWYTPFTASGERLVRKLCPQFFLIGK